MSLHKLAKEVDDTSRMNGWDIATWENFPVKIMMAVTELDEAHDFITRPSPGTDPLPEELADVSIRLMSVLYSVFGDDWHDRRDWVGSFPGPWEPIEVALWRILKPMSKAVEEWRHDNRGDVCGWLEQALKETFRLALAIGVDLEAEIIQKNEKNKQRGQLHGKARSAG